MKKFQLVFALVLIFSAATGAAGTLKGKLTGPNFSSYRLFALDRDGKGRLVRVSAKGVFSVSVKNGTTLQLVNAAGRYAGPVVCPKGAKAQVRLNGKGGNAGQIKIRKGFAVTDAKAASHFDKRTVPFSASKGTRGSGKLGLVRAAAKSRFLAAAAESEPGDDEDKDGIANTLDIDADGNGELDVTEGGKPEADLQPRSASTLRGFLTTGLNAHLADVTGEAIDEFIKEGLILGFGIRNNSEDPPALSAVNVDCLGLSYCTPPAGTATLRADVVREKEGTPWTSYDTDGDGLPNLAPLSDPREPFYMGVRPHVTRAGLHPGDTIFFKMTSTSGVSSYPVVLPFFFVTVPALKEYKSGQTNGTITYPATEETPGSSMTKPIALETPSLTLVFWKPQRLPIEGAETGSFIDIGHLDYKLSLSAAGSTSVIFCKPEDFSSPSSTLQMGSTPMGYAIFSDTADDVPVSNGEPLSFTLDAGSCLARAGFTGTGLHFGVDINADSKAGDETSQTVYFQLP